MENYLFSANKNLLFPLPRPVYVGVNFGADPEDDRLPFVLHVLKMKRI